MKTINGLNKIHFKDIVDNPKGYLLTINVYNAFALCVKTDEVLSVVGVEAKDISYNMMNILGIKFSPFDGKILDRIC